MKDIKAGRTARELAARAVVKVGADAGYSNIVMEKLLRESGLDSRDRVFASAIVYGTLERMLTIDYMLEICAGRGIGKLQPEVAGILRTAAYQLMYMDSVPESAAVNEAVGLTRRMNAARASGFVNAVLRTLIRRGKAVSLDGLSGEKRLSVEYSCGIEAVRIYLDTLGEERTRRFLEDSLGRPPVFARVNPLKNSVSEFVEYCEKRGVTARPREDVPGCVELCDGFDASDFEGRMHVQDLSSQLCALNLMAKPGMAVLDVCGAPGGKTFTVAEEMEDSGSITVCDLHENRLRLICSGAQRLGLSCDKALQNDAAKPNPGFGRIDRVLCDVPCSGLGVIRRKPEIKYKSFDENGRLTDIQYKILETSSEYLREGGRMIYSTCTVNRAENEEVAGRFLREHPEFAPAEIILPGGRRAEGHITLLPEDFGSDGFFIAAFERRAEA